MNRLKRDGLQLKIILIQAVLLYLVTNMLSMALKQKRMMGMSEAYCCILEYCLLLMMIQ